MGVNEQQLTNNGATRDNVIQLLKILKQRNLGNEIDRVEARRLINDIISTSEDNAVELRRSRRGLGKGFKEGYHWLRRLIQRLNTEENKEVLEELLVEEGASRLHELAHQNESKDLVWKILDRILETLDALDPFRGVGDIVDLTRQPGFWEWNEEQVPKGHEMVITDTGDIIYQLKKPSEKQLTERQNITTEIPQVSKGQNATTAMPHVTERQNATTQIPPLTRVQNVTTAMPHVTERQNATTQIPPLTRVQNVTTEMPLVAKGQNATIEVPPIAKVQNVTIEVPPVAKGQNATIEVLPVAKGQNITTAMPQVTERQNATTQIPPVTRVQNVTAEVPTIAKGQNATAEVPTIAKGQNATAEVPPIAKGQNATAEVPPIAKVQNVTIEIPPTTEMPIAERYSNASVHSGAEQGDLNMIKYFAENGADINAKNSRGDTLLHLAAKGGYLDIVEYLVEKGADVNVNDSNRYSPLHRAVLKGELDVVKYLVGKGAYVNVEGGYSRTTPLYNAAMNGNLDMAKYLIEKGADSRQGGSQTLLLAIKKGDLDLVKYLVEEKNVGVNAWVNRKTLLQTAIEEEKFDIAIFLVDKGANLLVQDSAGYFILHKAVEKGSLDLVRCIVESKGMHVDIRQGNGITSLHVAAGSGNLDLVKYLIEKGAQININRWVGTPLHVAVNKNDLEVVKYLINAGANVNLKDGEDKTPLHLAAKNGNLSIVKYLMKNGADLKMTDSKGKTPLHLAAKNGNLSIVKYLIENGADSKITDSEGKTPLQIADQDCHLDIVEHLAEKGQQVTEVPQITEIQRVTEGQQVTEEPRVTCDEHDNTSLHSAAKHGKLERVRCLIQEGTDINVRSERGYAPYLYEGFDTTVRNGGDYTPLHEAVIHGHIRVVKYLVENGADINAKSKTGRTPLHYAVMHGGMSCSVNGSINCRLYGNLDKVKYLVEKGADVMAKDGNDKTPLDIAGGNPKVVEFLSSYRCGRRSRREVSNNSWMNSGVNWVKGLISSTESPALLTSGEHNNHTIAATPEINTTLVNNTLLLGILATGSQKLPLHENLLSPIEQSMGLNNLDRAERTLREAEEKYGPSSRLDDVLVHNNKTGLQK
ncbi:ankyrin repeat domain-containing protein [Wolbachia endosymbiont of Folsomia candida]|uniref:ankyrin repeat domain-containing protein n=1 Tax=Wolbachia endosymbiont of Folsomia candida TaxID=169402 RepID=UPI000A8010F8|nr:ankyrin repeat domain-containing protein [Wolbachia endosymbiont of Folsomia candida]APR99067.1 hypothetical protein ASM33_07765 [Wolbachia endosymbiont of Folsomia candida]